LVPTAALNNTQAMCEGRADAAVSLLDGIALLAQDGNELLHVLGREILARESPPPAKWA
jgi:hypothetical protein